MSGRDQHPPLRRGGRATLFALCMTSSWLRWPAYSGRHSLVWLGSAWPRLAENRRRAENTHIHSHVPCLAAPSGMSRGHRSEAVELHHRWLWLGYRVAFKRVQIILYLLIPPYYGPRELVIVGFLAVTGNVHDKRSYYCKARS